MKLLPWYCFGVIGSSGLLYRLMATNNNLYSLLFKAIFLK